MSRPPPVPARSDAAALRLFKKHERLAWYALSQYCRRFNAAVADFTGAALEGLWRAALYWHNDGRPFSTYAFTCIRQSIRNYYGEWHSKRRLRQIHRHTTTNWPDDFFDKLIEPVEDDGEPDTIPLYRRLFKYLTPRQQYVLNDRFGLDGEEPMTLLEVSENMGVTRERVRQLEANALRRLRESPVAKEVLAQYLQPSPRPESWGHWRREIEEDENPWADVALRAWEDADAR